VEIEPPPRCKGCDGACLWYRVSSNERLTLAAASSIPIGSTVSLTLPEGYVLAGAALVYGLPLGALLVGGAVAAGVFGSDWAAAVGAAAALFGALVAAAPLRRRLERATLRRLAVRPVA
jgi:positive regulator of sigma E activity